MLYTNEEINKKIAKIQRTRKIISIIAYVILVPLLVYNLSLIFQALINPDRTPSFFGIKTYVIISGSMQPKLDIGDIVVVKDTNEENIKENDVISFRKGQGVVTHRIIKIEDTEGKKLYITKGDNNNVEDSDKITHESIEGKVIGSIKYLGNISLILQGKMAIIVIAIFVYIYISRSGRKNAKLKMRKQKRIKYEEENDL